MKKLTFLKAFLTAVFMMMFSAFVSAKITTENLHFNQLLKQHQGKVIYVDFWASWCVPCRKSFPWINQIQQKYGEDNFVIIAVNVDRDKTLADAFLKETPANFPIVYDPEGKLARQFKLKGMPSSYLLDKQGKVISAHTGFFSKKVKKYEQDIAQALASK